VRALLVAVRFLTILPVPGAHHLRDGDWGRATACYPAVGLLLGAILAGLDWALRWLLPANVAAALLLFAWVVLTGALHLDGFVDCCDALLAPVPLERRLEILRDIHAGAFGIAGVVLLLLLKYAALAAVPTRIRWLVLLHLPMLARWGMTSAVLLYPYALGTGLCWWAGLGWAALGLLVVAVLATLSIAQWVQSRIGGLTGDVYGAICELVEVVGLLTAAALAQGGGLS
jgi:adenosylcobinamide-GDP ribazoletransferase